jgi:hypothetical protein
MLVLLAAAVLCATPADKPKLVVTDLTVAGGLDATLGSALSEAVAQEVSSRGVFTVVSSHEMAQLRAIGALARVHRLRADRDSPRVGPGHHQPAGAAQPAGQLQRRAGFVGRGFQRFRPVG